MNNDKESIAITLALSERISDEIAKLPRESVGHINYDGHHYGALPLFGTIGATWLLRPDGSLWRADSDLGLPLEPLPASMRTMALRAGVERYPWLAELLPTRPVGAEDCHNCDGRGKGPGPVFCWLCGGLGWRLPDSKQPSSE
jgi:hypothetical protein